jgi:DNA-binding transcriptional MerR regulator
MEIDKINKLMGGGFRMAPEVYEAITTRLIKSSELGIDQRTLSHWRKEGLFIFDTEFEKHEHIRFSFVEYVWLNIIVELRKYDISLDVIRSIMELLTVKVPFSLFLENPDFIDKALKKLTDIEKKEFLNAVHDPEIIEEADATFEITGLLFLILESITEQHHISLLVNLDGEIFPFSFNMIEDLQNEDDFKRFYQKTHISISISEIITRFITGANLDFCSGKLRLITDREAEIIKILRSEKLISMTIHFDDNNKLELIEVEKKYDKVKKEARLVDLIMNHGYQTIEIKTQDGKIVHCKNLKKIKYDKV